MSYIINAVSALFIFVGACGLLTKSRNPTLRKMTPLEHITTSLTFLTTGVLAASMTRWLPILIGLIVLWTLRLIFNTFRSGRLPDSPPLPSSEFTNPSAVINFIDWWVSNDSQVGEVDKSSTQSMWNEGHRPDECASEFPSAREYFNDAFQRRLKRLQNNSEADWVAELKTTGDASFQFMKNEVDVGEEYGVDFHCFNYEAAVRQITDPDALNSFKHYRLSEILLSNQRRLLMWLFHDQFGKWYTQQTR